MLLLFTKNQHVGLWLIVHVTSKFFNSYLRVLMSKFRLDGLNSGELCYLYIYGKKLKITNMKSNVCLTQLNCNDSMSARRKWKYNSPSSPATLIINKDNRATKKQNFEKEAMVKARLSCYVESSLMTSEKIFMFVYFFCMQRVLIIQ